MMKEEYLPGFGKHRSHLTRTDDGTKAVSV